MWLKLKNMKAKTNYRIKLRNDYIVECLISYKLVPITIGGIIFPKDLIQFDLSNFDIILVMNWLPTYGAKIDCEDPKVTLRDERGREVCFQG